MATYTDTASLLAAINKEMRSAMEEVDSKGLQAAKKNAQTFYNEGSPVWYKRTGTYGDAPNSTGVSGFGNHQSLDIYMDEAGHGYRTGTFSAQEVWEAAETHSSGVLGMPGRWAKTESDVEKIINQAFSSRFPD